MRNGDWEGRECEGMGGEMANGGGTEEWFRFKEASLILYQFPFIF